MLLNDRCEFCGCAGVAEDAELRCERCELSGCAGDDRGELMGMPGSALGVGLTDTAGESTPVTDRKMSVPRSMVAGAA